MKNDEDSLFAKKKRRNFTTGAKYRRKGTLSFLTEPTLASFCLFSSFSNVILQKNYIDCSGIRPQLAGVEGKHADHLTTTTPPRGGHL